MLFHSLIEFFKAYGDAVAVHVEASVCKARLYKGVHSTFSGLYIVEAHTQIAAFGKFLHLRRVFSDKLSDKH